MNQTATILASLIGPCPACGNGRLRPVSDGELANFLCETCGACWHAERDRVSQVDASTCPGCAHRSICLAARLS